MSNLKGFKFFHVFLVILVSFLCITIFSTIVCGDNWVLIGTGSQCKYISYNSESINIDRENSIIKVYIKCILTDKGINGLSKLLKKTNVNLNDVEYYQVLYVFNYKDWKYDINQFTVYSKSDFIITNLPYPPEEGRNISPGSSADTYLNKILKDYNTKR